MGISFDRTFCVSDKCALAKKCDRHTERIKEWAGNKKKVVHRISTGDFYEEKKVCEMFGEIYPEYRDRDKSKPEAGL